MLNIHKMQVVVLAGGKGLRLRPVVSEPPKSMVDILGKPFLYYQIELMKLNGFKDFIFCAGYKGGIIRDYFGDGAKFGVKIKYSLDGNQPLGTAGALRKAASLLDEDFIVIYGDSYMDVDYAELVYMYYKFKSEKTKLGLMAVFKNKNKYDKSNIIFKKGKLLKYDKQRYSYGMAHIDYGISILNKGLIARIPKNRFVDLGDVYKDLVSKRLIPGYEVRNRFYEIGIPQSLDEFRRFIFQRLKVRKSAVFLDRDGTLNHLDFNDAIEEIDSPLEPSRIKLLPKVISALKRIKSSGYVLIIVSNQPAAAKGKVSLSKIYEVNNRFKDILARKGIYPDDILICPHYPKASPYTKEHFLITRCNCRKPKPGLLKLAARKFNLDLSRSYLVGDSYTDILAGKRAGVKTVFIGNYKCDVCGMLKRNKPDYIFNDLYEFSKNLK